MPLESSLKRDRIGTLFDMGFKTLKLDQNVFSIKLAPLTVLAEKDPVFLLEAMGCLVDLVKDFPRSDPKGILGPSSPTILEKNRK